ncbi:response regulator transcription factor [Psychrobacillus sp. INOP01]|uniref:response regulator transcription factor n=1 Tax=Psychrobacillus sp. INOP01 TaxID=2829187 RepID=UPI001BAD6499|nr:response regulator transcription factor [Psychrobacillus sp. INOP01]QUG40056.1 response regulator transcription factor [Psychrobacillus sp. INOP01]
MLNAKILVVDDEQAIGDMVDIILRKEGFNQIDVCTSYHTAETLIAQYNYDLFIFDIMLPDGTGLDLAEKVRTKSDAPIFFLSAKANDADKLRGFMYGADDYITKPFNPMELAARVKVQMKRYKSPTSTSTWKQVFDFGRFQLNIAAAELTVAGHKTILTGKLFHLLQFFCEHPGQVLSKEQIYAHVWGEEHFIDDNTIMVHIRKLREKIEVQPGNPKLLLTIRGIGYKLISEEH